MIWIALCTILANGSYTQKVGYKTPLFESRYYGFTNATVVLPAAFVNNFVIAALFAL